VVEYAIKKTDASHLHVVTAISVFPVYENCYAADELPIIIFKDPAGYFRMTQGLIFAFVENVVDVFIKWPNIVGIIFVNNYIHLQEPLCQVIVRNLRQLHVGFSTNVAVIFLLICSGFEPRTLPLHAKLKALYQLN
jgi:hypothetical protein